VYEVARGQRATRVYWQTQTSNTPGRLLYDKVAAYGGFIVYAKELDVDRVPIRPWLEALDDEPVTSVDRVQHAMSNRDIDALLGCYATDASIEGSNDNVLARGHNELRARYEPMFEMHPELRVEGTDRIETHGFIVQREVVRGRGSADEIHIASYQLDVDGLIKRERLFR
jgi:hypothetical protein